MSESRTPQLPSVLTPGPISYQGDMKIDTNVLDPIVNRDEFCRFVLPNVLLSKPTKILSTSSNLDCNALIYWSVGSFSARPSSISSILSWIRTLISRRFSKLTIFLRYCPKLWILSFSPISTYCSDSILSSCLKSLFRESVVLSYWPCEFLLIVPEKGPISADWSIYPILISSSSVILS